MKYAVAYLEKILKVKRQTITLYFSRAEFSHIKRIVKNGVIYFSNVTNGDIIEVKKLIDKRRKKSFKEKKQLSLRQAKKILKNIQEILYIDINDVIKTMRIEDEIQKIKKFL